MRWIIGGVLVLVLLAAGVAYAVGLAGFERHQGYYAPVFSPDGSAVYYIQRDTTGFAWGLGWQGFTGPASAKATSDVVSLRRLTLADRRVEVLEEWRDSPVLGRTLRTYRPALFQYLAVRLRMETPEAVEYAMNLAITQVPRSIPFGVEGVWSDDPAQVKRGEWGDGEVSRTGYSRWPLHGSVELLSVRAYGAHPPALLAYDHDTGETQILLETPAYRELFPDGVTETRLLEWSRRSDMVRIQDLERTHTELTARFKAEGVPDHEVWKHVNKEMVRLGFYPKPDTLTARLVSGGEPAGDAPLFEVPDGEMASGVFPDIEKAIAEPGKAIEKSMGSYIHHDHYSNSALLNEFFDAGGTVFRVRYQGKTYELTHDIPDRQQ